MTPEQASKLAAARARWKGSKAYRQNCPHPRRTGGGGSHDGATYVMSLRCPDCGRQWEEVVRYDGATQVSMLLVERLNGRPKPATQPGSPDEPQGKPSQDP